MRCVSYMFSCFFKKEQQKEFSNPLLKSFDSCETIDNNNHQYNHNNNITSITTKKVHFSDTIMSD